MQIALDHPEMEVRIFSDDTRPITKARAVGLGYRFVPGGWRRPPETDDADKERTRLEQEVQRLRTAGPVLKVGVLDLPGYHPLVVDFPFHTPLTEEQLERLLEALKFKYPTETVFDRQRSRLPNRFDAATSISALGAACPAQHTFVPASQQEIEKYVNNDYPDWLEKCRDRLTKANLHLEDQAPPFSVTFSLCNVGTRPVDDLRISFAKGSFAVMPPLPEMDRSMTPSPNVLTRPPTPPQGRWEAARSPYDPFSPHGMYGAGGMHNPLKPVLRDISSLSRPVRRDPNAFYYSERLMKPASSFHFFCEQCRHGGAGEPFEVQVHPLEESQHN